MENKHNPIIIELDSRNLYLPILLGLVSLVILFGTIFIFPNQTQILIAVLIAISICSSMLAVKMMRPDAVVLKIEDDRISLSKNEILVTEAAASEVKIELFKLYRYSAYSRYLKYFSSQRGLGIKIIFPDGQKIAFNVIDKQATFTEEVDMPFFRDSIGEYGTYTYAAQAQKLLDYFLINQVRFSNWD